MSKLFLYPVLLFFLLAEHAASQTISKYITVDQFGYLPESKKVAVIRDPQTGYDAGEAFAPGGSYAVVDAATGEQVFSSAPLSWNAGAIDASSGDKAWWFDFSSVTVTGKYYVLDVDKNVRSYEFEISPSVYNEVLKHAVRTFFYQRAGFAKSLPYAEEGWTDGASHVGLLQDKNARVYNEPDNAATEVDVHGGWYDAGDYNKYTSWTANYIVDFMRAYIENPQAFRDDYNIPESGNGIPDLLDEAKWGLEFLLRMQQADGGVRSIVGLSHASPPSSATGPSLYGTASTTATLNTAAAFAIASRVYDDVGMSSFAASLKSAAIKAWDWAEANPNVRFYNNSSSHGTRGLGSGQQEPGMGNETDYVYNRDVYKLEAACFLFEITGEEAYRDYFDEHYQDVHLVEWNYAYPFESSNQEILLHYTTIPDATPSVVSAIRTTYANAMDGADNFSAVYDKRDPYQAYIKDYTWGSNSTKASQGLMFTDMITYDIDPSKETDAMNAAEGYIHYIHGVNPLNIVYLSNMYDMGGDNCVNEFYHTWFANGSSKWDRVGVSSYGPAPGFLVGGPNPSYDRDDCCSGSCGSTTNNAACNAESITPPKGQPSQKSYKDFNTSWPLNSWAVTENSCGYQINYIRLLSWFVDGSIDCSGVKNGTALIDACGQCAGGTTGVVPIMEPSQCPTVSVEISEKRSSMLYPNPAEKMVHINFPHAGEYTVTVIDMMGKKLISEKHAGSAALNISQFPAGTYTIILEHPHYRMTEKVVKF